MTEPPEDDRFELYDLRVEVVADPQGKPFVCDHRLGEYFDVIGEMLVFPNAGRSRFPLYPGL